MELVEPEAAAKKAAQAIAHFRAKGLPIVHIQHVRDAAGATSFAPDTEGVKIHASVAPLPTETVFVKHYANSFRETPLLEHLRALGVEQLVIAGMMTSMCVDAASRAGFDFGFDIILLHDAMTTKNLVFNGETIPAKQVHGAFLAALGSVYGKPMSVDEFVRSQG